MGYIKLYEDYWFDNQNNEGEIVNNKWIVGKKIGSGQNGIVYSIQGDHTKIIKIYLFKSEEYHESRNESILKNIKLMENNSNVCSKIYDYGIYDLTNTYYVVSEKLNTKKVESEFNYIEKKLGHIFYINNNPKDYFHTLEELSKNKEKTISNIANRWLSLFKLTRLMKLPISNNFINSITIKLLNFFTPSGNVDFHPGNFGYDKAGNLKMLDI